MKDPLVKNLAYILLICFMVALSLGGGYLAGYVDGQRSILQLPAPGLPTQ